MLRSSGGRFFKCQIVSSENVFFNYSWLECCSNNSLASKKDFRPIRKMNFTLLKFFLDVKSFFLRENQRSYKVSIRVQFACIDKLAEVHNPYFLVHWICLVRRRLQKVAAQKENKKYNIILPQWSINKKFISLLEKMT